IEITVALGAGTDSLTVLGTPAGDTITLGSGEPRSGDLGHEEINLGGGPEPDLLVDGVEQVQVDGGSGNDVISADGGNGTQAPLGVNATIDGGLGDDT